MLEPGITIDDSLWPLRRVRFTGRTTLQQYEAYLEHISASLRRRERYIGLFDLSLSSVPSMELRKRQAEWLQRHEHLLQDVLRGVAFIITSPVARLVLSTIFHLKPMPTPYIITSHMPEAVGWVIQRMEQDGFRHEVQRIRHHYGLDLQPRLSWTHHSRP